MANLPTPLQEINHPLLTEKSIRLFVKRDDLIHSEIMGNKWRKLKYNLLHMREKGINQLVTMGGAFSNHIAATAAMACENKFKSVGIIRGEELNVKSNPTLQIAHKKGMELHFIDRGTFREWRDDPVSLKNKYPNHYFLPEGGTNEYAIRGAAEIIFEIKEPFDKMVVPVGTGGTLAGLISSVDQMQKVVGVSALKGKFIHKEVQNLLNKYQITGNYEIIDSYHFGGYGKTTAELVDFINWFKENYGIPLDPIYTGKCFFAVWDMIKTNKFEKNLKIVLLHTGGLQGIEGFNRKKENIIQ